MISQAQDLSKFLLDCGAIVVRVLTGKSLLQIVRKLEEWWNINIIVDIHVRAKVLLRGSL